MSRGLPSRTSSVPGSSRAASRRIAPVRSFHQPSGTQPMTFMPSTISVITLPILADPLLDDLITWLRIPSISTGGGREEDLRAAAAFVCERVDGAGGDAQLLIT